MKNINSYFITYMYVKEIFTFELFAKNTENRFCNAIINFDKKIEEFTIQDYNDIKTMIAESLTEELNNYNKEIYKNLGKEYNGDKYKITKENITIINIIPKKYEEIKND